MTLMQCWIARQPTDRDGQQRIAPLGLHSVEPQQLESGRWSVIDRFGTLPPSLFPTVRPGQKRRATIVLEAA